MLTAEQIQNRTTGIGGSDAAAAVGVSPWKSPLQVYLEKRGEIPAFEGNEATKWGNYLETPIRQEYSERTGRVVRLPAETIRHPQHEFMLCHPDGVTEDARLFEAKATRSGDRWGIEGSDDIPEEHLIQVQHNMAVLGFEVADVAVLIGGFDFRLYEVRADAALQQMLVEREGELWARILRGDAPAPSMPEDVRLLYGHSSIDLRVQASDEILGAFALLASLKAKSDAAQGEVELLETQIKAFMQHADTLVDGKEVLCTWKASKGSARLDTAALRSTHPEIAAAFTSVSDPARRFLLKRGSR